MKRPKTATSRPERRARARRAGSGTTAKPTSTVPRGARWLQRLARTPAWAVAGALMALHLLLVLAVFHPAPHPGGDNATYVALARSLLTLGEYRDLFDPARPVHTQFPPGYPLIIAVAIRTGFGSWVGLKLVVAAFSVIAVGATYLWLRRRGRRGVALGVSFLVAVSPGVVSLARWELSDVPFWAFTMAALLCWERAGRGDNGRVAAASLLTAGAYMVRSAALPLMLAAAGWLAWGRRWGQLGILGAAMLPTAGFWWLWTREHGGYFEYVRPLDPYQPHLGNASALELAARMAENVVRYAGEFLPVLLTGRTGPAGVAMAGAVLAVGAYGWWGRMRRPGVAELFLPLYLGVLLLWNPVWSGERLLLPVYPLLLAYGAEGGLRLARHLRVRWWHAAPAAVAVVVVMGLPELRHLAAVGRHCTAEYRAGNRYPCQPPQWADFYAASEAAAAVLAPDAVVMNRKPAIFYIASGFSGRVFPFDREPETFLRAAEEAGARYVLADHVDELSEYYLAPILMRRPEAFCMVPLPGTRTTVFGILPDARAIPDRMDDPGAAGMMIGFDLCGPEFLRPAGDPPRPGSLSPSTTTP